MDSKPPGGDISNSKFTIWGLYKMSKLIDGLHE